MSRVDIVFLKWPDRPHWRFTMQRFAADEHGVWLGGDVGLEARRGDEPPVTFHHPTIKLITPGRWWTAIWNNGGRIALYVDIATPARWLDGRVEMIDLDLDLVVLPGGRVEIADEDEFEEHRSRYGYPERVVAAARATTAELVMAIERGDEPFGSVAGQRMRQWLERDVSETSPTTG